MAGKGRGVTHGMRKTPTYNSWATMKQRCYNPAATDYASYGGRGIRVCEKWQSFEGFFEDMGVRPDDMTLDRCDVNGDYCLENCKWSSDVEQQNNRTISVRVEYQGEQVTMREASERCGVKYMTLWNRYRTGLRGESLFRPVR